MNNVAQFGETKNENLLQLITVQKRFARIILDASYSDNSVELFSELGWLPIDDVIRMRKLCLMYKIVNGCCPDLPASILKRLHILC